MYKCNRAQNNTEASDDGNHPAKRKRNSPAAFKSYSAVSSQY